MNYTLVDREEAPAQGPIRKKRRIPGMEDLIDGLVPGKVAKIELTGSEKPRPVMEQIFKTAARKGKAVDVWEIAGVLYAEAVDDDDDD